MPSLDPTVIARIQKLMALTTERGASEAEAALAAEHVQRLLIEHNLSMAAVEASGSTSGAGGTRTREGVNKRQVYKWQRDLMAALAELNFCVALTKFKRRDRARVFDGYDLIGRVDNVTTTRVMFEYLTETIERLAREEVQDPAQYFTRYAHSFKEGCSDRIVARLNDEHQRMVQEQERKTREEKARASHPGAATGNALVVTLSDVIQNENDLNKDFQRGVVPGTTARERMEREQRYADAERQREERLSTILVENPDIALGVARYMASGFSRERAEALCQPPKPETEAQRRRRQQREQRDNDKYWERIRREQQRLDPTGYQRGHKAGADVSLNRQANYDSKRRLS